MEVKYLNHMGDDLAVVNAARVSFGKRSEELSDKDEKLIGYLAKHGHRSPFGHCFASFHVKAPIFVARQLVKHKFLRWNEISRRYVDSEPEFYLPDVWRGRSKDKKQGSEGTIKVDYGSEHDYNPWGICCYAEASYHYLIDKGVAPEQARMILPLNTYTEWYWSGSLDAFADMCNLRCKEDTQWESRVIAEEIDSTMGECFPVSWRALREWTK